MIAEHRPARRTWSLVALAITSLAAAVAGTDAVRGQQAPRPGAAPAAVAAEPAPAVPTPPPNPGAAPEDPGLAPIAPPPPQPVDDRLAKRLPEVKLDNIPLKDSLDFLRDAAKVNLFVDQRALEAAGVELDSPVTLNLKDITVDQAFRLVGRAAAPTGVDLGATADGDVIIFGVRGQATAVAIPPQPAGLATRVIGQPGADRATTRVYDVDKLAHGDSAQLQNLTRLVTNSLALGKSSLLVSAEPFNGKLVLTATPDLHDQVQNLLAMLEQSAPPPTTKPTPSAAAQKP